MTDSIKSILEKLKAQQQAIDQMMKDIDAISRQLVSDKRYKSMARLDHLEDKGLTTEELDNLSKQKSAIWINCKDTMNKRSETLYVLDKAIKKEKQEESKQLKIGDPYTPDEIAQIKKVEQEAAEEFNICWTLYPNIDQIKFKEYQKSVNRVTDGILEKRRPISERLTSEQIEELIQISDYGIRLKREFKMREENERSYRQGEYAIESDRMFKPLEEALRKNRERKLQKQVDAIKQEIEQDLDKKFEGYSKLLSGQEIKALMDERINKFKPISASLADEKLEEKPEIPTGEPSTRRMGL